MKQSSRRTFLQSVCVGGLAQAVMHAPPAWAAPTSTGDKAESQGNFSVFDGLLFKPMPDLRTLGMPKLLPVPNVWRPQITNHQEIDPIGMAQALLAIQRYATDVYFDVEEWTLYGNPPDLEARIDKHLRATQIARATTPGLRFGFYGVIPTTPYWPILRGQVNELETWHAINRRSQVIADNVDYLFPSLYTFYDDPKGWEVTARTAIQEARQFGKPVYPFLWFEFHDGTPLQGKTIPRDYWRRQLEVCREFADGVVLWGGFAEQWNDAAPWWLETKSFLSSLPHKSGP